MDDYKERKLQKICININAKILLKTLVHTLWQYIKWIKHYPGNAKLATYEANIIHINEEKMDILVDTDKNIS